MREGQREYHSFDGKVYRKSLSNTCLDCHSNKTEFCDRCHSFMAADGLWGIRTTLIEKEAHLLSSALDPEMSRLVERHLKEKGIDLRLGCTVSGIDGGQESATVHLHDDAVLETDFVVLCLGVVPETTLAVEYGLELGPTGAIAADDHFRTSDLDIYARGDCVESTHRVGGQPATMHMPESAESCRGWTECCGPP